MIRVPVNPQLVRWARERAGLSQDDLVDKFKKLPEWEEGTILPTLKQLEAFARKVHAPIGCMFLSEPLTDDIPISDFREFDNLSDTRLSVNLLHSIYACQERQIWFREYASESHGSALDFVGSASMNDSSIAAATMMRKILEFDLSERHHCSTWRDSFHLLIQHADKIGILVMVSGIVENNTHRRLDPSRVSRFLIE